MSATARAGRAALSGSLFRGSLRGLFRSLSRCLVLWLAFSIAPAAALNVGSKRFTESYILAELVCQSLREAGQPCTHRPGLGNTGVLDQALRSGGIGLYPEYTGTIVRELLQRSDPADGAAPLAQINTWLAPRGLRAAVPLGFNNTYALALRQADAERLGLRRISDLTRLPAGALRLGLSHEFLARADGWPALQRAYALPQRPGAGLDHGLAYEALKQGTVDLIDVYTTDAKIGRYGLQVLIDDRGFFPAYDAVLLLRAEVPAAAVQVLQARLQGRIDAAAMIAMNAAVEIDGRSFADAARAFLAATPGAASAAASSTAPSAPSATTAPSAQSPPSPSAAALPPPVRPGFVDRLLAPDLARLTAQHLGLVFGSLAAALLVGVPLGVLAWARPRTAGLVLGVAGVVQTVPSLALLALLIAALGAIGFWPAMVALFIYALLPVVSNTHAGLNGVPAGLQMAARALGLRPAQVLRHVSLPLAAPVLLAGARTAAVINVGTATLAAFIGAGGYGERIVAGLAVNDHATMLAGALPAAVLALAVHAAFRALERRWQPAGDAASRRA